ncbi:MAG TPA: PDR/VanB family oxidoreductase [Nocardioidaceae bacterium]|nr:PDR/VanB family oxidoreductase [Nocardioidaceae bacterium]
MIAPADAGIGLFFTAYRGYLKVVTESPLSPLLSRPSPVRRTGFELALTVSEVVVAAEDVVALTLTDPTGTLLPAWSPGAHLDVFLPSGTQRQYSLCGNPADRSNYRVAVRLIADGGGGSREIHEQVRVGDTLRVRGPRNAFLMVDEPSYLFVAGGIGITPLIPMVRRAEQEGAKWHLVYLGRSRDSLPFLDELAAYGHRVIVRTDDEHGRPDMREILELTDAGAAVIMCGPVPLVDAAKALLPELNPTARLYSERFSAPPVRGGQPFSVQLARSGKELEVAADESLLSVLRREVPGVAYSCQQGFCGTCKVGVLKGEVEHRDQLLLDNERDCSMLPCLSRGSGTLLLDL